LLAPVVALVVTAAANVEALTAQATTEAVGTSVEIGLGAGAGTGKFGGPGVAAMFYIGAPSEGFVMGAEFVGLFHREHYASGGAFWFDPGHTRTTSRLALSAVGRYNSASGTFVKAGLGLGALTDIDNSAQDYSPLLSYLTLATTFGVGGRWSVGSLDLVPRADVMFHLGHGVQMTGVAGLAVAVF
jgi:hypothetical protein